MPEAITMVDGDLLTECLPQWWAMTPRQLDQQIRGWAWQAHCHQVEPKVARYCIQLIRELISVKDIGRFTFEDKLDGILEVAHEAPPDPPRSGFVIALAIAQFQSGMGTYEDSVEMLRILEEVHGYSFLDDVTIARLLRPPKAAAPTHV
jgi:hypothetical protein